MVYTERIDCNQEARGGQRRPRRPTSSPESTMPGNRSSDRAKQTQLGRAGGDCGLEIGGFAAAGAWDVKRSQFAGMPGERPGPGAPNEPNFPPWWPRNGLGAPNEANWSEPEARDWGFAARETRDARRTQLARFLRPPASAAPRATRKTKPIGGGECGIMALSCYFEVL